MSAALLGACMFVGSLGVIAGMILGEIISRDSTRNRKR